MSEEIQICKEVIKKEIEGLKLLSDLLDESIKKAVELIYNCKGKTIVMGVGKSGHIGNKISATLSSTGTPSFFVNPNDAMHGDIGVIDENDVIIAISKEGESSELLVALEYPKRLKVPIIAITTNEKSQLASLASVILKIPKTAEACPLNLAPTTSTTSTLVLGDCLAIALMNKRSFKKEQFAQFHPGGNLGKKLKKVEEIMTPVGKFAFLPDSSKIKDALKEIVSIPPPNMGICVFWGEGGKVTGIITDGDLKRLLLKHENLLELEAKDVMIKTPHTIFKDELVITAINQMEELKIRQLIVLNRDNSLAGIIDLSDIIKYKIV
ncbi:MAG: KpsF/GutQ family sugar-phosphate isomerase [Exilispira sp.]|jgi:arabinose-5-phosphate isomerase|nr:KpsF/GutQ family sugar-phosphate isomerase [Exilispira sp.]